MSGDVRGQTVVLLRRPPSPSIHTSDVMLGSSVDQLLEWIHTLRLDLFALRKREKRGQEIIVVNVGHDYTGCLEDGWKRELYRVTREEVGVCNWTIRGQIDFGLKGCSYLHVFERGTANGGR